MRAVLFKRADHLTENNTGPSLLKESWGQMCWTLLRHFLKVRDCTSVFSPGTAVASAQFSAPITLNIVRKHCTRERCAWLTLAQADIN